MLLICRLKACRNIRTYPFDFYYIPLLNTWTLINSSNHFASSKKQSVWGLLKKKLRSIFFKLSNNCRQCVSLFSFLVSIVAYFHGRYSAACFEQKTFYNMNRKLTFWKVPN